MLAKVDTVVFDKTGTLTTGSFSVSDIHPNHMSEMSFSNSPLRRKFYSDHPISLSIRRGTAGR